MQIKKTSFSYVRPGTHEQKKPPHVCANWDRFEIWANTNNLCASCVRGIIAALAGKKCFCPLKQSQKEVLYDINCSCNNDKVSYIIHACHNYYPCCRDKSKCCLVRYSPISLIPHETENIAVAKNEKPESLFLPIDKKMSQSTVEKSRRKVFFALILFLIVLEKQISHCSLGGSALYVRISRIQFVFQVRCVHTHTHTNMHVW